MPMHVLNRALRNSSRFVILMLAVALSVTAIVAQTPAPARSRSILGVITEIHGNSLTLKSDAVGVVSTVLVPEGAKLLRIAPGQKDISTAQTIPFNSLQTGDRVLVRLAAGADDSTHTADRVIAIKQEDLAEKQKADLADWQKRGVTGLVRSVDAATGDLVVATGGSQSSKTITLHTSNATVVRRYSPDSTQFAETHLSTLAEIHKGDQIRARGNKSDGALAVEEIVTGSFRTFAATVVSVDESGSTLSITDLTNKKTVVVRVNSDSNLRRLPETLAEHMAAHLNVAGQHGGAATANAAESERPNPEALINSAPTFKLAELKKGDAVLLLTTEGTGNGPVTAITVLAGVEPLLRAGAGATQNMLMSSWNMNGGDYSQ